MYKIIIEKYLIIKLNKIMKIKILIDSTLNVNFYEFDFKEIYGNG